MRGSMKEGWSYYGCVLDTSTTPPAIKATIAMYEIFVFGIAIMVKYQILRSHVYIIFA